ncbi:MAG TPA: tetratricopeptide repeat protein, partial [Thermodesulfovibrionales bacterium]|nr:tetratricopeptide repeat protein [Thermodesulfovibrionales bacterium]
MPVSKVSSKRKVAINEVLNNQRRYEKESKSSQESFSITTFIPLLLTVIVSCAVYFNALYGDFVYDDRFQIVKNPWLRDIKNVPMIFSKSVWSFAPGAVVSNYYRPFMHIVYLLNYHLFHLKPWGFHLVNILFHCGASVFVFLIIRELLTERRATISSAYLSPPFIAAIIFAVHPIHTEAVTWIAGLPDVAFTFFFLLSFFLYIRSKAILSGNYLLSVVCFAIAALFKEPALTLPIILFAYDYVSRPGETRFLDYLKRYSPYLVVGLCYLVLRIHALGEFAPTKKHVVLSAYEYAINVFPLFVQYLGKLVVPLHLNAFYVFHPIYSLLELKGLLSLIVILSFAVVFVFAIKKDRHVFLGLIFVTVPLLPVLYIPALGENTFTDRYLYLPSVGYVLLLATCVLWVVKKLPGAVRGITVVFVIIAGLFIYGTISRNTVWKDNFELWSDTVKKSPDSVLAHDDLGIALTSRGQVDKAIAEFQIALRLKPDYAEAHYNLGCAYAANGQMDKAIAEYQAALGLEPNLAEAHSNLGNAFAANGQMDMAIAEYRTVLQLQPDFAEAHYNLGNAFVANGQVDMAIAEYQTALDLEPNLAEAHSNLGNAFAANGQMDMAIA